MKYFKYLYSILIISYGFLSACQPKPSSESLPPPTESRFAIDTSDHQTLQPVSKDSFKYSRNAKSCINSLGEIGRNTNGTLECADFKDEDWSKKNFKDVSFRNSKLNGINFFMADLSGADFSAADLSDSSFFKTNLAGALFDDQTKLPPDLTKEEFIKRGGVFKDYLKLDQNFTDAVLSGNLQEAEKLRLQLAALNDTFFDRAITIRKNSTKEILGYLLNIGVDFFQKSSTGRVFFDELFKYRISEDMNNLMPAKDEIKLLLERTIQRGTSPDQVWEKIVGIFSWEAGADFYHPEVIDLFLQVKEFNINRTVNDGPSCYSLGAKAQSLKSFTYLFSRGYDPQSNPCLENDTAEFIWKIGEFKTGDGDLKIIQYLESKNWNFKVSSNGRSKIFETLVLNTSWGMLSDDKDKRSSALRKILYLKFNSEGFLNSVPNSTDDLMKWVVELLENRWADKDVVIDAIKKFGLVSRKNSEGKNLIQIVPLFGTDQYGNIYLTASMEIIERLVDLGVPFQTGKDSLLITLLSTFNFAKSDDVASTTPNYLLEKLLDLYKKTGTPLEKTFNNESVIFIFPRIDVLQVLVKNGYSLNDKDAQGLSLYWRYQYLDDLGFQFLLDNHVPFDITEEVNGKFLLSHIFDRLARLGSWYTQWNDTKKFFDSFVQRGFINLKDQSQLIFFKKFVVKNQSILGTYIFKQLRNLKLIKKIRFVQCEFENHQIFIEDPNMHLIDTFKAIDDVGQSTAQFISLAVIVNNQDQVFDARTSVESLKNGIGISLNINSHDFSAKMELQTTDLSTVTLNGKTCTIVEKYPQPLQNKYQHLYISNSQDDGSAFYINLKGEKRGEGFWSKNDQLKTHVSLLSPTDQTQNLWPVEIKDHYVWQMYGNSKYDPFENIGAFALPKSVVDNPAVGSKCVLQYFERSNRKVQKQDCTLSGMSY